MSNFNTNKNTQEIPYGVKPGECWCGCGQKTRIATKSRTEKGWTKGQPLRYIQNHGQRKLTPPPEPKFCECGCGQITPIAKHSYPQFGHIKGQHVRFVAGHNARIQKRPSQEERFWQYVDRRGTDECWGWTGGTTEHGYGLIKFDGKQDRAHRVSYKLHHGPIPENTKEICHTCDNPPCCNPKHLFLGTHIDNINDMVAKNRHYKFPPRKGTAHFLAKLTEQDVHDIRQRAEKGESHRLLAKEYGVHFATISKIVSRKIWQHI